MPVPAAGGEDESDGAKQTKDALPGPVVQCNKGFHRSPFLQSVMMRHILKEQELAESNFDYYADHASPTPTTEDEEDTLPLNWPTSKRKEPRSKSPGRRT